MTSRAILIGITLAGSGGVVAATGARATVIPIARPRPAPATHAPGDVCAGGQDAPARVAIVPDTFVSEGGRERVEYHSEIAIARGDHVGVAWTADVVDDRGVRVGAPLDVGSFAGRGGNVALTGPLVARLADGFYTIRVRAAITSVDDADTVISAAQRVEVTGGHWLELGEDEWFERSRASEAFSAAEIVTRAP